MRIRSLTDSQAAAAATAAAPTSGTTVATLTVTGGDGVYDIAVESAESGTVDANPANMNLKHGSTVVSALLSTSTARRLVVQRKLAQSDVISVVVGGTNGGAGAVYSASITLDRIS